MVRGQCRNEWPQRESRLRGHPDGRRSPQSDGRAGDREGDQVRLRWLHTRGPRALLTPARRPRGGGRRAARQQGSRRSTARPEPRLRMRPSPKRSISQGHHEAQGEGGGQLNKTVSDRGGANAAGCAVDRGYSSRPGDTAGLVGPSHAGNGTTSGGRARQRPRVAESTRGADVRCPSHATWGHPSLDT